MKHNLVFLFLFIIPFFASAQKSSYIKNRISFDISYMRVNYHMIPQYQEKKNGVSLSANYGLTKFMESGLYYYRYNLHFSSYNFTGLQNKFHIFPFFIESNNRYFRLDAYIFNQAGLIIHNYSDNQLSNNYYCNCNIGIGTSFYLFKHIGVNFEYKWDFILSKHVENPNFQSGFNLGLSLKY